MSEELPPPLDLLPLLFFTALMVYALAMGSADLARSIIRVSALAAATLCLAVWGVAALSYDAWGRPTIDEFYGTALLQRRLGPEMTGVLLLGLAVLPLLFAVREMWRLKTAR